MRTLPELECLNGLKVERDILDEEEDDEDDFKSPMQDMGQLSTPLTPSVQEALESEEKPIVMLRSASPISEVAPEEEEETTQFTQESVRKTELPEIDLHPEDLEQIAIVYDAITCP